MMPGALAIETHGLTRAFGSRLAVDSVDLQVPRGCVYGFVGPNGAGKTSTIRLLLGLLRPTGGEAFLNGASIVRDRRSALRGVGALVDTPSLYPHLTGRENLDVTRRMLGVPVSELRELLQLFDLEADADRLVRDYSSGMRQALGLALAWLGRPAVLVLDEPTSSLDPVATKRLRGFLTRLAADHGVTVFLSSHVLSEIEAMASRVGIIHKGRLLFQGELGSVRRPGEGSLEDAFLRLVESVEANGR